MARQSLKRSVLALSLASGFLASQGALADISIDSVVPTTATVAPGTTVPVTITATKTTSTNPNWRSTNYTIDGGPPSACDEGANVINPIGTTGSDTIAVQTTGLADGPHTVTFTLWNADTSDGIGTSCQGEVAGTTTVSLTIDPAAGGGGGALGVPALGGVGLGILSAALAGLGFAGFRRRK